MAARDADDRTGQVVRLPNKGGRPKTYADNTNLRGAIERAYGTIHPDQLQSGPKKRSKPVRLDPEVDHLLNVALSSLNTSFQAMVTAFLEENGLPLDPEIIRQKVEAANGR